MAKSLLTQTDLTPDSFETFWSRLWSYGCHCFDKDTDRPLSALHHGEPVDRLDSACRNYKRCQACASEQYGENCIGEMIHYDYFSVGGHNGEPIQHIHVTSSTDSCEHKIFECDHRFALEMLEYHEVKITKKKLD